MKLKPARGRLSVAEIMSATDGIAADGNGLYLKVAGTRASWVFRYTSSYEKTETGNPKRVELGLGSAERDDKFLCETAAFAARETALEFVGLLARGIDPKRYREDKRREEEEREEARRAEAKRERRTLGRVVRAYHEEEVEGHYDDKHCKNWIGRFEKHLKPWRDEEAGVLLWDAPIDEIEAQQLADFIRAKQRAHAALAKKLRQGLDAVFEWANLKKWCAKNIVHDIRRTTRMKASRANKIARSKGWASMDYRHVPDFMQQLRAMNSTSSRALQFTILTAARTNEALAARWSEIDFRESVWTVPGERMKGGEEHRVPLPPVVIELLKKQRDLDPDWVFPTPSRNRGPLSNMSMLNVLKRLGLKGQSTVHGFRKSFSTWGNESLRARWDVIEACLAHEIPEAIRRTYNQADYFDERREVMQHWARYLEGTREAANEEQTEQQVAA